MMHAYEQMNVAVQRTHDLLALALESAREAEDAANRAGIVSPSPAQVATLRQAVELAHNVSHMKLNGTHFVTEDMEPRLPSYAERKAVA